MLEASGYCSLPHLLLPSSRNSADLFGSLSSAILSTCPVHCSLLLTSFSVKLLCAPVSSLNSIIILLYSLVTLAIFHTQLFFAHLQPLLLSFGHCQGFRSVQECQCHTSAHDLALDSFEIRRSAITPSTALRTFAPACALRRTSLSPSSRPLTLPLLDTQNCPPESVSSPPAWCPALPSGGLCAALLSSLG